MGLGGTPIFWVCFGGGTPKHPKLGRRPRRRALEETIDAEMMINMNHKKVYKPDEYAKEVEAAVAAREKKRERAEEKYEKLIAKRKRV